MSFILCKIGIQEIAKIKIERRDIMSKEKIEKYINAHYTNMLKSILLAKVDYDCDYKFLYAGQKMQLICKKNKYDIVEV
jgi:hypothetical protein